MRISDWSSDVCSSDLRSRRDAPDTAEVHVAQQQGLVPRVQPETRESLQDRLQVFRIAGAVFHADEDLRKGLAEPRDEVDAKGHARERRKMVEVDPQVIPSH